MRVTKITSLLLFILASITLLGCVTRKDTLGRITTCPDGVNCRYESYKNTQLIIKKDDTGQIYLERTPQIGVRTLIYYYEKDTNQAYVDGHYIEEIHFEIPEKYLTKDYDTIPISKSIFGVFCYCKGKAGYYPTEIIKASYKNKVLEIEVKKAIENQQTKSFQIKLN